VSADATSTEQPGVPWRTAMETALYGPGGFYHRPEGGPGHHFRTASSASVDFARAVLRLLAEVDELLGRPSPLMFVEMAAARGALLTAVHALARDEAPGLAARLQLVGVELADRPAIVPEEVGWVRDLADLPPVVGVLFANEWLDNVPLDAVEQTAAGPRVVLVDRAGDESLGAVPDAASLGWLERWWPQCAEGDRAEIGLPRDEAWAAAVRRTRAGLAVAADYSHDLAERTAGVHAGGTLTGYRDGRQVLPVPDGSCDITAHVAIDSVAAAGAAALPATASTLLTDQRTVLRALGVVGDRPPRELASTDPRAYLQALSSAGQRAELTAHGGLGDFGWVLHAVGVPLPASLAAAAQAR
jgi:SAM-dependent MidA family methyltransferase